MRSGGRKEGRADGNAGVWAINEQGDSRAVVIRFIEVHSDLHACMGMVVRCAVCGRAVACIWRLDGMAMI